MKCPKCKKENNFEEKIYPQSIENNYIAIYTCNYCGNSENALGDTKEEALQNIENYLKEDF